jgi:hypothetical protein
LSAESTGDSLSGTPPLPGDSAQKLRKHAKTLKLVRNNTYYCYYYS